MRRAISCAETARARGGDANRAFVAPRLTGADKKLAYAAQRGLRLRFDGSAFVPVRADAMEDRRPAPAPHDGPMSYHPLQVLRLVRLGRLVLLRDAGGDYPELIVTAGAP
jgi:hypothetical protein